MLDNDSDLSVSMVYRLLNEGEEVDTEISNAGGLTNSNNDIDTIEENTIEK